MTHNFPGLFGLKTGWCGRYYVLLLCWLASSLESLQALPSAIYLSITDGILHAILYPSPGGTLGVTQSYLCHLPIKSEVGMLTLPKQPHAVMVFFLQHCAVNDFVSSPILDLHGPIGFCMT